MDNYAVVDGKYFYFDLPFTSNPLTAGAGRRVLPMLVPMGAEFDIRAEITLPPAFHKLTIAPGNQDLALPGETSIHIAGAEKDGKYIITNELRIVPAIVNPQAYPALVKAEAAMREKSATLLLLEHE